MSDFLSGLLTAGSFPSPIKDLILASYEEDYQRALALNSEFAPGFLPRVGRLSTSVTSALLKNPHYEYLDAVLSTDEQRTPVLVTVLDEWVLSPADQIRLLTRPVKPNFVKARVLLRNSRFTPEAQDLARLRTGLHDHPIPDNHFDIPDPEVTTSVPRYPDQPVAPTSTTTPTRLLRHKLSTHWSYAQLYFLSGLVTERFGPANTPASLAAWRIFLNIAEQYCEDTVSDVLNNAAALA
jgi:hypothetical protein